MIKIADLGRIVTGKTPPTKQRRYFGGQYPFITPSDLEYDTFRVKSTATTISEDGKSKFSRQFLPENAITFTCIASVGKIGVTMTESLTNQQINSIIVNKEHDWRFVYYLLRHEARRIHKMCSGVAVPIINKGDFEKVEVKIPGNLADEQSIALTLSAYDELIENNQRRIQLLEQSARLIYKEWFVRFRFPGHERVKIKDGVPDGWDRKTLGELARIKGGKQYGDQGFHTSWQFPVFGGNGIQGYSQNYTHAGFLIIFGRVGANCGSIHYSYDGAWVNNNASAIVPAKNDEIILQHLLAYNFAHIRKGAAQPFIPNGLLSTLRFLIPPKSIASEFCSQIRDFRLQQRNLFLQTRHLVQIRDILLPRLMKGDIDT